MTYAHLGDTRPKARKRHQCYLCGKWIEIGWVYVRRAGVCDGEFSSTPMHVASQITDDLPPQWLAYMLATRKPSEERTQVKPLATGCFRRLNGEQWEGPSAVGRGYQEIDTGSRKRDQ